LIELLVVIAIIAVLIGLLLPAVQKVRATAARIKCANNLKQISLAAMNYHDVNNGFPLSSGQTYATWAIALLPYLEQDALYQQFVAVGGDAGNAPGGMGPGSLAATSLPILACPSDSGLPSPPVIQYPGFGLSLGATSYRANTSGLSAFDPNFGADGVIVQTSPVRIVAITDGTSNTILFGEFSNFDPNWPPYASFSGSPANFPLASYSVWTTGVAGLYCTGYYPLNFKLPPIPADPNLANLYGAERIFAYGSGHSGGANFAFCDGRVIFLSNAVAGAPGLLPALSTIAGGEVVSLP
jgi:prepilin-type processing-associated H-X9-DG protein